MSLLTPDAYMDLLVQRRDAYYAERGQPNPGFPALLEWFIRDGDELLVDMAAIEAANAAEQPKRTTKPRTYRPASHWRDRLARIDARLDQINGGGQRHDTDDPAAYGGIGIRQTARQRARHGARIDRLAAEHTRLSAERRDVAAKLARAEKRERA